MGDGTYLLKSEIAPSIVGVVTALGATTAGTGFTTEKTAEGKYTIKLTNSLGGAGAFLVVPASGTVVKTTVSRSEFKVETKNTAGELKDTAFDFHIREAT